MENEDSGGPDFTYSSTSHQDDPQNYQTSSAEQIPVVIPMPIPVQVPISTPTSEPRSSTAMSSGYFTRQQQECAACQQQCLNCETSSGVHATASASASASASVSTYSGSPPAVETSVERVHRKLLSRN